jgi:hypothetical protein
MGCRVWRGAGQLPLGILHCIVNGEVDHHLLLSLDWPVSAAGVGP